MYETLIEGEFFPIDVGLWSFLQVYKDENITKSSVRSAIKISYKIITAFPCERCLVFSPLLPLMLLNLTLKNYYSFSNSYRRIYWKFFPIWTFLPSRFLVNCRWFSSIGPLLLFLYLIQSLRVECSANVKGLIARGNLSLSPHSLVKRSSTCSHLQDRLSHTHRKPG